MYDAPMGMILENGNMAMKKKTIAAFSLSVGGLFKATVIRVTMSNLDRSDFRRRVGRGFRQHAAWPLR